MLMAKMTKLHNVHSFSTSPNFNVNALPCET